jgi:hypothetical protein
VVGTNGFLELVSNNQTRTLGSCTAGEKHDAGTGVLERGFEKANGNSQGNACASEGSLVVGNGPWVTLQLFKNIGDLELGLLDGKKETGRRAERALGRLVGHGRTHALGETKHLLDLLRRILLAAPENVGLGTLGVADLVDLSLLDRSI